MENAVMQQIGESMKKSLGSLRCSEHNKPPKMVVKGRDINNLSIEVSGRCDGIIKKATDKLN